MWSFWTRSVIIWVVYVTLRRNVVQSTHCKSQWHFNSSSILSFAQSSLSHAKCLKNIFVTFVPVGAGPGKQRIHGKRCHLSSSPNQPFTSGATTSDIISGTWRHTQPTGWQVKWRVLQRLDDVIRFTRGNEEMGNWL